MSSLPAVRIIASNDAKARRITKDAVDAVGVSKQTKQS
jgi:hypothetical protein